MKFFVRGVIHAEVCQDLSTIFNFLLSLTRTHSFQSPIYYNTIIHVFTKQKEFQFISLIN